MRIMSTPPVPPAASSPAANHLGLSRQQKADAIRNVKEMLAQVGTDWEYVPPPPPAAAAAPSRAASTASRSGVLGAWRAAAHEEHDDPAKDSWDEMWESTEESSDSDDSDDGVVRRSVSYRRADTPPPAKKRRRHRRREGVWRERIEDSDFEVPEQEGWRWKEEEGDGRRAKRRWLREQMRENPGLRTWLRRRDQWTGADREGYVPVGESRFEGNPLHGMVTPSTYREIYQRCVVKGAELPVPVNLKNMVEALVEGWKADDMWPPKSTEVPVVVGPRGEVRPKVPMGEEAGKSMSGRVRKYLGIR
jgi:hypothetical protein